MRTFEDQEHGIRIRMSPPSAGLTYPIAIDTPGVEDIPLTPAQFDALYGLMQKAHHALNTVPA